MPPRARGLEGRSAFVWFNGCAVSRLLASFWMVRLSMRTQHLALQSRQVRCLTIGLWTCVPRFLIETSRSGLSIEQRDLDETALEPDLSSDERIRGARFWKPLMRDLFPVLYTWHAHTLHGKILLVLNAPILFFLALTSPVADTDLEDFEWSRALLLLQCWTAPLFIALATGSM